MDHDYDVIIVGAGQTGTHCARKLAAMGYKVIILERQKEIGEPNFSTAGTSADALKQFDLPKEVAPFKWHNLVFAAPGIEKTFPMENHHGYVLDFRKLRQWLAEDAASNGAEISVGTEVTGLSVVDGKVVGVKYKGIFSSGELTSKIVINATGNATVLAKEVGLDSKDGAILSSGLELELLDVEVPVPEAIYCWLGDAFIPNGYAWVFPLSKTKVKVGVGRCLFGSGRFDLKLGLKRFVDNIPWLAAGEPLEFHGGSLTFNSALSEFTRNGFINLSNIANPLGGEGIRHGLQAAEFAAQVCGTALEAEDYSLDLLCGYDKLWREYSDNNWKTCQRIAKFVYSDTNDSRMNRYLSDSSHLSGDDWYDVLFNYQFQKQAKGFLSSVIMENASKILHL